MEISSYRGKYPITKYSHYNSVQKSVILVSRLGYFFLPIMLFSCAHKFHIILSYIPITSVLVMLQYNRNS